MKPTLILDAYLDPPGAARFFAPRLAGPFVRVHLPVDPLPADPTAFRGVIVTGSAASVCDPPPWMPATAGFLIHAWEAGVPVLGVCFGHQLLAWAAFGPEAVRRAARPEVGYPEVRLWGSDPVLDVLDRRFTTFVSHEDEVLAQPGMTVLGATDRCAVHAFRFADRPAWGVQFHLEYGGEEELRILRYRAERHPELGLEPDRLAAAAISTEARATSLLRRFEQVATRLTDAETSSPGASGGRSG